MDRILAILPVCLLLGVGPGLLVVRRFRWTPIETLTASVGLSFIFVFSAAFVGYWTDAPDWTTDAITAVAVVCTAVVWRDLRALWRRASIRRTVIALAALAAWTLVLVALIKQYGGGNWCCDWLEHYQRTAHFVDAKPDDFLYIGRYTFPTRPPMMNVLAAQMTRYVGLDFRSYQVSFVLLNVLVFLACCLVSRHFTRSGRPADPVIVALVLGANPMFFMNSTYAWTKAFTAFYVLLGVSLYVSGMRRNDRARLSGAFLALAAATITHYSAAIPLVLITADAIVRALRSRDRLTRARRGLVAVPAVLVLGLWFGHALTTFGASGVAANPTVLGTDNAASIADHASTRLSNLVDTFVPGLYDGYRGYPEDASPVRRGLDQIFTWYQGNAVLSLGCINGVLSVVLIVGAFRQRRAFGWPFWALLVGGLWIAGSLAHGDPGPDGLAMIALQPATYLGLAFLAARLPDLSRFGRRVWLVGAAIDVVGIGCAVWFQMAPGAWARTPNWTLKTDAGVIFLADAVEPWLLLTTAAIAVCLAGAIAYKSTVAMPPDQRSISA